MQVVLNIMMIENEAEGLRVGGALTMLIVKKFGGTSVADKERIFNVVKRCLED